jgi:threonyl-tRNA synthetase
MSMSDPNSSVPERDHRRLGRELGLFSFDDEVGPGLALWHPKGALVRHLLEEYWRKEQIARGYELVYSPHIGRSDLWQTSGHLDFYRDSMFPPLQADDQEPSARAEGESRSEKRGGWGPRARKESYFVKPMNCPFHMRIFATRPRSYRELPLRFAELGTVYRYERSGVLTGLLRVRGFTQDDAHIFCTKDELENEIRAAVRFVVEFLARFEFRSLAFSLSTRPTKSVGDAAEWEIAESALARALDGIEHEVDAGGGAFYGPKIDVHVEDTLGRKWQLSTVQLDFNLPARFELSYVGPDGARHRPYVLHRAIFGSLERFFAILLEHYAGAFPFWLAPVQAKVLPIAERHHSRALEVTATLRAASLRVGVDSRGEPLSSRVRDAELEKVPYVMVIGDRELENGTVSVRARGSTASRSVPLSDWIASV